MSIFDFNPLKNRKKILDTLQTPCGTVTISLGCVVITHWMEKLPYGPCGFSGSTGATGLQGVGAPELSDKEKRDIEIQRKTEKLKGILNQWNFESDPKNQTIVINTQFNDPNLCTVTSLSDLAEERFGGISWTLNSRGESVYKFTAHPLDEFYTVVYYAKPEFVKLYEDTKALRGDDLTFEDFTEFSLKRMNLEMISIKETVKGENPPLDESRKIISSKLTRVLVGDKCRGYTLTMLRSDFNLFYQQVVLWLETLNTIAVSEEIQVSDV